MPLYEYFCAPCDRVFTDLRSIGKYLEPTQCPDCRTPAPRILATAPQLNVMRASLRKAHETNERSAHEPRTRHGHVCNASCGHQTGKTPEPSPAPVRQTTDKRPWMLGH